MSTLAFDVRHRDEHNGLAEVVPVVDDTELTDLIHAFEKETGFETRDVSYGGLIPGNFRFGPMAGHFLAMEGAFVNEERKVPLLGCDCGEWGCWPLLALVTVGGDRVTWSRFEQPYRRERDYSGFGPFHFDRRQYGHALADLESALADEAQGV
jgi:hypothetical protein